MPPYKRRKGKKSGSGETPTPTAKKKFTAPTPGYEDVYFTSGSTKDAAQFQDTVNKLSRCVGTQSWKKASVLSKAMGDLIAPIFTSPTRPSRVYMTGQAGSRTRTLDRMNAAGEVNTPTVGDIDYRLTVDEFLEKKKRYDVDEECWAENNARGYNLVLQHCPPELEAELRNSDNWTVTENERSVVKLLLMIRDITHHKRERKQTVMEAVESDADLYLTSQGKNETIDDFYRVFTAQVETINAHGGQAGFHPAVFAKHLAAIRVSRGIDDVAILALSSAEKAELDGAAKTASCEEYLGSLFLLMSDDTRFKPLKTQLENNYILGKQEYPHTVLAAKRMMADYVPASGAGGGGGRRQQDDTNVAFAEAGRPSSERTYICYACGDKHKGSWRECPTASPDHLDKVAKLVKTGHFTAETGYSKIGTQLTAAIKSAKNKKGVANTEVAADDGAGDEDDEDNDVPSHAECLRLMGHIRKGHVSVNVNVANDTYYDTISGDDVHDFGFAQVGGRGTLPNAPSRNGAVPTKSEWVIQGRRGSNPTKKARWKEPIATVAGEELSISVDKKMPRVLTNKRAATIPRPEQKSPAGDDVISKIQESRKTKTSTLKLDDDVDTGATLAQAKNTSGPGERFTLDPTKLYLDSCATYCTFLTIRTWRT